MSSNGTLRTVLQHSIHQCWVFKLAISKPDNYNLPYQLRELIETA